MLLVCAVSIRWDDPSSARAIPGLTAGRGDSGLLGCLLLHSQRGASWVSGPPVCFFSCPACVWRSLKTVLQFAMLAQLHLISGTGLNLHSVPLVACPFALWIDLNIFGQPVLRHGTFPVSSPGRYPAYAVSYLVESSALLFCGLQVFRCSQS